jgi:threonine dehydrogenase-like Zn-dependent dehydrogenase
LRVPFADFGAFKVPDGYSDEQVLFLSDIYPTGYMAAENCSIERGQTIAVFGCGPVGLFSLMSACPRRGPGHRDRRNPRGLELARRLGAEVIDYTQGSVHDRIVELTKGAGPDAVIDAVGMESMGSETVTQKAKAAIQSKVLATDRPYALNDAILCCRLGGVVSVPGVYIGAGVPTAMGALMNKGLTRRTGQTHIHKYMPRLMKLIEEGAIDPTLINTHRTAELGDGSDLYETFREKKDGCIKAVLFPNGRAQANGGSMAQASV